MLVRGFLRLCLIYRAEGYDFLFDCLFNGFDFEVSCCKVAYFLFKSLLHCSVARKTKVGDNAFTAAGSTVTHDVPDDSLYISREKEEKVIEGWVDKKLGHRRWEK